MDSTTLAPRIDHTVLGPRTATGFSGGGATLEAVSLLSTYCPVKASGGVDRNDQAIELLEAGATRIGSSSGDTILDDAPDHSASN
ncbi:MAG: hypothetical protein U5K37_11250 [Natrialbaceae archaeon]|nr:hypothetical protein [Natrialbaceae archaeon]